MSLLSLSWQGEWGEGVPHLELQLTCICLKYLGGDLQQHPVLGWVLGVSWAFCSLSIYLTRPYGRSGSR